MAGLHVPLSTLRQSLAGTRRMTRGQCGSLHLHCKGLPPSAPCRPPGAFLTPLFPKVPTCRAELAGSDTGEGSAFNQSLVDFQTTGTGEVSGAGRSVRRLPLRIEGVERRPPIIRTRHGLRILKRSIPVSDAYPRLCRGIESR
jgi:hypothetical protein